MAAYRDCAQCGRPLQVAVFCRCCEQAFCSFACLRNHQAQAAPKETPPATNELMSAGRHVFETVAG